MNPVFTDMGQILLGVFIGWMIVAGVMHYFEKRARLDRLEIWIGKLEGRVTKLEAKK